MTTYKNKSKNLQRNNSTINLKIKKLSNKDTHRKKSVKIKGCCTCGKNSWLDQCDECRTQICYFCLNPETWGSTKPIKLCPKCGVKYPEDKFCYHNFNMNDLIDYLSKNLYEARQLSDSDVNLRHIKNSKNRNYKIIRLLLGNPHSHKTYNDVLGLDPNFKKRMNSRELHNILKESKGKKFEGKDRNWYLMNGTNDVYIAYYEYDESGIKLTRSMIRRLLAGYRPKN